MVIFIQDNKIVIDCKEYPIEKKLCQKLDLMVERVTQDTPKQDNLLINEGGEGEGKSNSSVVEALWFKLKTGREVRLFFKIEPLMRYAQATEKKIIIWDEPSLDSLSIDQINNLNKDVIRLFMTCRKKRHIFIVNYTKFWKFPEYIVVDRAIALINMYTRNKTEVGRFNYIKKKRLEILWNAYAKRKERIYNKVKSFGGKMPNMMDKEFDKLGFWVDNKPNATYNDYEKHKDIAINSIRSKEQGKSKKEISLEMKLNKIRFGIYHLLKKFNVSQDEAGQMLGYSSRVIRTWAKIDQNKPFLLGKQGFEEGESAEIKYTDGVVPKNLEKSTIEDEYSPIIDEKEPETSLDELTDDENEL